MKGGTGNCDAQNVTNFTNRHSEKNTLAKSAQSFLGTHTANPTVEKVKVSADVFTDPSDWPTEEWQLMDELFRCPICKEFFETPMSLQCGHSFWCLNSFGFYFV